MEGLIGLCPVISDYWLLLQLKSPGAWGECITSQNWGRFGMKSCPSVVCCETSSWLVMKTGAWGEKSIGWNNRFFWGDWNVSRATLHESDMAFVIQWSGRSSHISAARWIAHQSPTAIVPVRLPGGQNPNSLFLLLRCYYRWCGKLMVQDEWQDKWKA